MKESFFQTCEFSHQWTSLLQSVLSAQAQSGLRADLIRCEMALWPPRARPFEVSVYILDSIVFGSIYTLTVKDNGTRMADFTLPGSTARMPGIFYSVVYTIWSVMTP